MSFIQLYVPLVAPHARRRAEHEQQCLPCRDANGRPLSAMAGHRVTTLSTLAPHSRVGRRASLRPCARRHWFDDRLSSSSEDDNEEEAATTMASTFLRWRAQRLLEMLTAGPTVSAPSARSQMHGRSTPPQPLALVASVICMQSGAMLPPGGRDDRLDDIDEVEPHDGDDNSSPSWLADTLELAQGATDGERGNTARRERGDSTARASAVTARPGASAVMAQPMARRARRRWRAKQPLTGGPMRPVQRMGMGLAEAGGERLLRVTHSSTRRRWRMSCRRI